MLSYFIFGMWLVLLSIAHMPKSSSPSYHHHPSLLLLLTPIQKMLREKHFAANSHCNTCRETKPRWLCEHSLCSGAVAPLIARWVMCLPPKAQVYLPLLDITFSILWQAPPLEIGLPSPGVKRGIYSVIILYIYILLPWSSMNLDGEVLILFFASSTFVKS